MLNYFVNFINTKLGLEGDLLEVMNESFSWTSGKENLLRCAGLVTMPLIKHIFSSQFENIYNAPYVAIGKREADGFKEKLTNSFLLNIFDTSLVIAGNKLSSQLIQSIRGPISYKLIDKQFPDGDDGYINAEAPTTSDTHLKRPGEFSKLYVNIIIGMCKSIEITSCFYQIYRKSQDLSTLLPPPFNSKFGLPLAIFAFLAVASRLSYNASEQAKGTHAQVHKAREQLSMLVKEGTGEEKARNVISNKTSKSISSSMKQSNEAIIDANKKDENASSKLAFITGLINDSRIHFVFATFGSAVIGSKYETQNFYSMINEVNGLGWKVGSFISLYFESKNFGSSRDMLLGAFTKLTAAAKTVGDHRALITQSKEAALSINDVYVSIPDKASKYIDIESLEVKPGEICALRGANGAGKTTIFKAIQTGTGLALKEGGSLTRALDASFYMTTQDQDIDRTQNNCLWEKLKGADSNITKEIITEQLTKLGFSNLVSRLEEKNVIVSGGQRKACVLLRAINSGAKLVLLDEPFSAVDFEHISIFRELIKSEADNGTSFLIIDHTTGDEAEALYKKGRIYILSEDKVTERAACISR